MKPLWKKDWIETDDAVMAFTVGEDPALDQRLIPFDLIGSAAHADGLLRIGMLTEEEHEAVATELSRLKDAWEEGTFGILPGEEDMHTAIERALTETLGDAGKRIHTGRSRNDQIITAVRLYLKKSLMDALVALSDAAKTACDEGDKYPDLLMPGYTHMQRAMPSSVAFWYASFAEGFADALESGLDLLRRIDRSPLGAAAGFGVPILLDRAFTAEAMGFSTVHINAAAVQNSRGRFEAALANWFVEVGRDVEKLAWDVLLFSTAEFGFVKIPETLVTGSSIMPQKKNPDVVELLRAAPSVIRGLRDEIERVIEKLPSNYHRDFQLTKGPAIRAVDQGLHMLSIVKKLLENLTWQKANLKKAFSIDLLATHRAVDLVKKGMPFREAYAATAKELKERKTAAWRYTDSEILEGLSHLGAPGNPGLLEARQRIDAAREKIYAAQKHLFEKWTALLPPVAAPQNG